MLRYLGVLLSVFGLWSIAAVSRAQDAPAPAEEAGATEPDGSSSELEVVAAPIPTSDAPNPPLRILATAGIAGRFGEAVCDREHSVVPHARSAFTGRFVEQRPGAALVLDTGGLLAPHGVMRFANRDLPEDVVELVAGLGYEALALGENDLGAPRPRTLELAARLSVRGIPYVASNLSCEGDANAFCEAVWDSSDPPLLVEAGATRIAFLAFLGPSVLQRVAPDRSQGLTLEAIDESLPRAVRGARAAGADLVVVVLDSSSDDTFALAGELPEDARPDLVFLAHEGNDIVSARPATLTPVIVSPPPGRAVEVIAEPGEGGLEVRARPLEVGERAAAPVGRFAAAVGGPYCAEWGSTLSGGHLERPIDGEGVALLAAQIVREFAGADVAFLNIEAVNNAFELRRERLTRSDFYVALEYDEPIVVADVPASWLFSAQGQLEDHRILAPGLTTTADEDDDPTEEDMRIRGRAAVPHALYRVATIRFLAAGGDGALPDLPEGSLWTTLEHTAPNGTVRYYSLREVVLDALEGADERDPRDARPNPNDAPEWVIRGQLDGDFSGSTVSNDASYSAALLDVESSLALGLEVDLHADMTTPLFTWENRLYGQFRAQWAPSSDPGAEGDFTEAADQLQLRSLASFRGLRGAPDQIYVPDLYVEVFVESEVTQPDSRDYRWLLLRPTLGTRFPLLTELDVKLQIGLQIQALDPSAEIELGAGASILLRPWTVIEADERSLTAEGGVDFFAVDLFDQNRWQLRGQLDLALDLAGPLAVTFGAVLYVQQEGDQNAAVAFTATAGLRLAAVNRTIGP